MSVTAQSASVEITDNGNAPAVGKSFSLLCNVSRYARILKPILSYQWMKHNDTITQVGTNSSSLSFNSLKLSDIGLYNCHVNINYNHMFNINVKSEMDYEIQLPGMNYVTVTKRLIII